MLRDQYEMIIKGGNLDWCRPYFGSFEGKDLVFAENECEITGMIIDGKEFTNLDIETKEFQKLWDKQDERINVHEGECRNCPFFEDCQAWENECITWEVHSDGEGSMWVTIYTIDGKEHYIEVNESNYEAAKAKIIVETATLGVDEEELEFIRE